MGRAVESLPGLSRRADTLGAAFGGAEASAYSSCAPAPTATHARSEFDTDSSLNDRAEAAIRVSACAIGMGGFVSPFFTL